MSRIRHEIELVTQKAFAAGLPPTALGEVLRIFAPAARGATRMIVEGRSTAPGRRPAWLDVAADVRLEAVKLEDRRTTLHMTAPTLLDAAPQFFEQQELWPRLDVDPQLTALDFFGFVLDEVASEDSDSDHYDPNMLKRILSFGKGLDDTYGSLRVRKPGTSRWISLDRSLLDRASALRASTPEPRQVRVAGKLDMLRASTESFTLVLDDGSEVHGTASEDININTLHPYFGKRVLVHGNAIFRPSGRLLRIDAGAVEDGERAPRFWSRLPEPLQTVIVLPSKAEAARRHLGVNHFFGQLPGEESEAELLAMLEELG